MAADIDLLALQAVALNAAANGVAVETTAEDLLAAAPVAGFDVVLVGDLFYERRLAGRVLAYVETAASLGATVLIGDPKRNYLPKSGLIELAVYDVVTTRELEDREVRRTKVWRVSADR